MLLDRFGPTTTHALIWAGFDVLLLVLLCMHVYWFYFIFRIAVRVRRGARGAPLWAAPGSGA